MRVVALVSGKRYYLIHDYFFMTGASFMSKNIDIFFILQSRSSHVYVFYYRVLVHDFT